MNEIITTYMKYCHICGYNKIYKNYGGIQNAKFIKQ